MRVLSFCCMTVVFARALAAQQPPPQPAERAYVNVANGWSISYPGDWTMDTSDAQFVRLEPPASLPRAMVGIHAGYVSHFDSLPQLADWGLTLDPGAMVLSRERRTLADGTPALLVESQIGIGVFAKSRKLYVIAHGAVYIVAVEALADSFATLAPYFDRMLQSFAIREAAQRPTEVLGPAAGPR